MKNPCLLLSAFLVLEATRMAQADVSSTFDTSIDGWILADKDPGSMLAYQALQGDILFTDGAQGNTDFFSAPTKFLGDDSTYLNGTFSFQIDDSQSANSITNAPLIITDTAGDSLSLVLSPAPTANQFNSYSFVLNTSAGFSYDAVNSDFSFGGGPAANQGQIATILGSVASIYVPADVHQGTETDQLDNVYLTSIVPEPSTWGLLVGSLFFLPFCRKFLRRGRA